MTDKTFYKELPVTFGDFGAQTGLIVHMGHFSSKDPKNPGVVINQYLVIVPKLGAITASSETDLTDISAATLYQWDGKMKAKLE